MATIKRFEDLEVWKLAREQVMEFNLIAETTSLGKDYSLKNQMDESSGSVKDCIAEGFDRSGNKEFKSFLVISKASNAEYRSQLNRCIDRKHFNPEKFQSLYEKNITLGNKLMALINYLTTSELKGQRYK